MVSVVQPATAMRVTLKSDAVAVSRKSSRTAGEYTKSPPRPY